MSGFRQELRKFSESLDRGEQSAADWVKKNKTFTAVSRIPGDASTRRYYRATTPDGPSYIVMKTEPFAELADRMPFLAVQRVLVSIGVDVPEVLDFDPPLGHILLEDLGDMTLLRKLQDVSETEVERHFYEKVLDSLVALQVKASQASHKIPELDCFKLRFDFEKLMWEVNFTIEQFYSLYLKRTISAPDARTLADGFGEICRMLAAQPTVFTHRDFHSRNIMVAPQDRLVMIDFQDARMGPPQYDLASLLRDSYYQLEEAQVTRLTDYYVARWEAQSGQTINRRQFDQVFELMAVQRGFKAIGSFASFLNKRGDATYLKYIGNTFESIRRLLLRHPEYSRLREVLFHYYYF